MFIFVFVLARVAEMNTVKVKIEEFNNILWSCFTLFIKSFRLHLLIWNLIFQRLLLLFLITLNYRDYIRITMIKELEVGTKLHINSS